MIKLIDVEFPETTMVVAEDFDIAGSIRFHINMAGKHAFFVLSSHDKNKLLEMIQSV